MVSPTLWYDRDDIVLDCVKSCVMRVLVVCKQMLFCYKFNLQIQANKNILVQKINLNLLTIQFILI
jgi:hypothetical protein